ncbi:MAG: DNA polymerase IV [Patescibacteria group bacterium]|nr:DNA polymerase IV [Patescibacteria group bacterium]
MQPINLFDFPRAIVHIDGDSFFASCEVAKNPKLKGKPVVTGLERGIVSALSYEAKAMGVKRAMRISEVKKICPEAIFLPSDYETYSLFSMRMYNIVRRYTPEVEEYSIDECFADLTGLRRPLGMSYEAIAFKIKKELDFELGITFSLGLAPTKVLAKIGSKYKKPSGLTIIKGRDIHLYLSKTEVGKVWGIGPQTSSFLNKFGINSALQFVLKDEQWIKEKLTKPHYEIWQELRGESVYKIELGKKNNYKSISKTKTFTPASNDKEFVFSQLSKNVENACIKIRRHKLSAKKIFFFLKTQDYKHYGVEIKLSDATFSPNCILNVIRNHFEKIFNKRELFRATGIILSDLNSCEIKQPDLFGKIEQEEKFAKIFKGIDEISKKYGKHSVFLGTSFQAMNNVQHQNKRGIQSERKLNLFRGETKRKKLYLPMLGEVK